MENLTLINGRIYEKQLIQPGEHDKTLLLEISEAERKILINLLIQAYKKEAVQTYIELLEVLTEPEG